MTEPTGRDPETAERTDDALLAELSRILYARAEPPREVVDAAMELFTWRTVDAELAALTFDSLVDDQPVRTRAEAQPRILTFEIASTVIEMEIDAAPSGSRILGQVVPAAEVDLELRLGEIGDVTQVTTTGRSDEMGRFVLPLPSGRGLASLRCTLPDGSVVETARVRL